ncbi:hypothetical protein ALO42_100971 [Pseudomonas syringae pv. atrofaciens]|uniref:Uncharacterized protein n=4 Tax=Pseudomonas syringae group TaxID=136849 RepID=A0A3M5X842_9PSED|nr:Unknown protein sequence [Pseudomonas syringae pv. aceris]KPW12028.1 hypothetical protein ALO42_100971 [Pseudomonas syringae pv. atrofaciens]KPX10509.1 hypothetical protein ALO75_101101 [Pseudomonas syringae pv. coryli]KPY99625.1 hypothetical protein ALO85_100612 [Pseudomonas syringae pv. aptata]RMN72590.1 hypothetical protein ALQ54_100560 [Pseudomonas syringae]RMU78064.1 hypothetical protein ALP23_100790 [Pseudomonas syringae pv. apii]
MPVEEFRLGTQQNSFRKRSRTCAEVKGSLAHIHSRQIRWVCTRLFLVACHEQTDAAATGSSLRES